MSNQNWVSSLIDKCEPIKPDNLYESKLITQTYSRDEWVNKLFTTP
ncbi:MAG: hypothetical protein RI894_689 [Bacteroidota bacterium]|jgi:hypothetical protein